MKQKDSKFLFLSAMIVIVALSRLIPHAPNATPIGAIALFGTASFEKKWHGLFVGMVSLFISDLFVGLHKTMLYVYLSFVCIALLGCILRKRFNFGYLIGFSIAGSLLFYIVTNFGVWHLYDFYPKTLHGLWLCYVAGLPFLKNTLLGDLGYNAVLFGITMLANHWVSQGKTRPASKAVYPHS